MEKKCRKCKSSMKTTQKKSFHKKVAQDDRKSLSHCASGKILNFSHLPAQLLSLLFPTSHPRCDMIFEIHPRQTKRNELHAKEDENKEKWRTRGGEEEQQRHIPTVRFRFSVV